LTTFFSSPSSSSNKSSAESAKVNAFSKYANTKNPLILDYISSIPDRLSGAERIICDYLQQRDMGSTKLERKDYQVYRNRVLLADHVYRFHDQAGTRTNAIRDAVVKCLLFPTAEIFVSIHQPNLFAYSGIFKKILLLQTLKSRLQKIVKERQLPESRFVNLFLLVDHDFMDDYWMRTAELPSITNNGGIMEFRMPVRNNQRWKLVCNMEVPNRSVIDHWHHQLIRWLRNGCDIAAPVENDRIKQMAENLADFWEEIVEVAYSRAKSYADFNSFMMSQIVNKVWGYDTLFVRLSEISNVFREGYQFLLENFRPYSGALELAEVSFMRDNVTTGVSVGTHQRAPLWLHCSDPECGSKASVKLLGGDGLTQRKLGGICMSCKKQVDLYFHDAHHGISDEQVNELSPRAIPILLLLARELGVRAYGSGIGGSMGYVMVGRMAFEALNIKMPFTVAWGGEDCYYGINQWAALRSIKANNKNQVINLIDKTRRALIEHSIRIKPLLDERTRLYENKEQMHDLLAHLNLLKQEQRKSREIYTRAEKVKKAIEVRPCIIDYAVNFGLKRTEEMWRLNLEQNDDLSAPLLLV
jgi:hypothetical protein